MRTDTLGLVMIVRNEAHNLEHSLQPVAALFDEVVVVDSGSSDGTSMLAAEMGARVYDFTWVHDFSAARNYSIEKAKTDWLFWLDGDNAIDPKDVAVLRDHLPVEREAIVWALERVVPGGETLWQKRCFPRRSDVRFQGRVHEQITHPRGWKTIMTPVTVRHWGYSDPAVVQEKALYYQGLLAKSLEEDPRDHYAKFQAARCWFNLRRFTEAADLLKEVAGDKRARAENRDLWIHAQHLWAKCLARLGQDAQANNVIEQLLDHEPKSGLTHYERGRLAYREGDYDAAQRHLEKGLALGFGLPMVDLNPVKTRALSYYFLGKSLENQNKTADALRCYESAVASQPDNLAARTEAARLQAVCGLDDRAKDNLEYVLKHSPGDRAATRLLARLEEAA